MIVLPVARRAASLLSASEQSEEGLKQGWAAQQGGVGMERSRAVEGAKQPRASAISTGAGATSHGWTPASKKASTRPVAARARP